MKITRMVPGAVLAAMLAAAAIPAPAAAQLGGLKRKLKGKVVQSVVEKAAAAAGVQGDTASAREAAAANPGAVPTVSNGETTAAPQGGPRFSEYLLEITPELLDRFEKGLAAEAGVRDDIARLIGKELSPDDYDRCRQAVMTSPEGQKIYLEAGDLVGGDASMEQLQKMSREIAARFDKLTEPKCGLDSQKRQQVRDQHAERLAAAAPQASALTPLQLSLLKERVLPFCAAAQALAEAAGELRIPTESNAIYWVYTRGEVDVLQPRCARLASALKRGG